MERVSWLTLLFALLLGVLFRVRVWYIFLWFIGVGEEGRSIKRSSYLVIKDLKLFFLNRGLNRGCSCQVVTIASGCQCEWNSYVKRSLYSSESLRLTLKGYSIVTEDESLGLTLYQGAMHHQLEGDGDSDESPELSVKLTPLSSALLHNCVIPVNHQTSIRPPSGFVRKRLQELWLGQFRTKPLELAVCV